MLIGKIVNGEEVEQNEESCECARSNVAGWSAGYKEHGDRED